MLGLYVSDHPLNGVEHVLVGGIGRARSRRCTPTTSPTDASSRSAASSRACSARSPSRATSGRSHARGPRGLDRRHGLPADLPARRPARGRPTPCCSSRAALDKQRGGGAQAHRDGGHRPRPVDRGVSGPVRRDHPGVALHPAGDRPVQGGARRASRASPRCASRCRTVRAPRWCGSTTGCASRRRRRSTATSRRCSARPACSDEPSSRGVSDVSLLACDTVRRHARSSVKPT